MLRLLEVLFRPRRDYLLLQTFPCQLALRVLLASITVSAEALQTASAMVQTEIIYQAVSHSSQARSCVWLWQLELKNPPFWANTFQSCVGLLTLLPSLLVRSYPPRSTDGKAKCRLTAPHTGRQNTVFNLQPLKSSVSRRYRWNAIASTWIKFTTAFPLTLASICCWSGGCDEIKVTWIKCKLDFVSFMSVFAFWRKWIMNQKPTKIGKLKLGYICSTDRNATILSNC